MNRAHIPGPIRAQVIQRASGRCEYCYSPAKYSPDSLSVEHIVPLVLSGTDRLDNLALSCQGCNNAKYTKITALDPNTGEMAELYHPRQHRWEEHFQWSEDTIQLLGLTPTGRATVAELELNREGVVNLRRLLRMVGEHPPTDKLDTDNA